MQRKNIIDDMVDVFGYDYVIGYCLCSEYKLKNMAETEQDEYKREKLLANARRSRSDAERLTRERCDYGL